MGSSLASQGRGCTKNPLWGCIDRAADALPEATALRVIAADGQESMPATFSVLRTAGAASAAYLHSLGVLQGSIVLTAIPNTGSSVALSIGMARLGAVWAPADQDFTVEQILRLFDIYDPIVAFLTADKVEAIAEQGQGGHDLGRAQILNVPSWEELLAHASLQLPAERPIQDSATATMVLTSGTTGMPKSVLTPVSALRRQADGRSTEKFGEVSLPDSVVYFGSPAWVSYFFMFLQTASTGKALVLGQGYTNQLYFDAVIRHKPSFLFFWPEVVVDFITLSQEVQGQIAGFVKFLAYAGARTPASAVQRLVRGLPNTDIIQAYGSSEAGIIASLMPQDHAAAIQGTDDPRFLRRLESAGKCSGQVRIVGDEGNVLPVGVTGSIQLLSSPAAAFAGYYKNPAATAAKWTSDGWFITGDLGRFDEDGYLYIDGRDSETIVVLAGDNVYPSEIESVLTELPGVMEVAVVKVEVGEAVSEVGAFVRVEEGAALSVGDIKEQCNKRLGQVWTHPTHIFIQTEKLPRNTNGKCIKSVLTAQANVAVKGRVRSIGGA